MTLPSPSSEPPVESIGAPVAVLTGAARGLGAAVARRLSDAGWRLVLLDAPTDPALAASAATAADLAALATGLHDAVAVPGDVRKQDDVDRAVTTALERYGRLDAAVAIGGVAPTPLLVPEAGAALVAGEREAAADALVTAAAPIDDVRGTRAHRLRVLRTLGSRVIARAFERA